MHDVIVERGSDIALAQALNEYGVALKEQRKYPAAILALDRAKAILPGDALIRANLSSVLLCAQRYPQAWDEAAKATDLDPKCLIAWQNRAVIATALRLWELGEQAAEKALEIAPADPRTIFDRAQLRLSRGDWTRGLADYETRLLFKEAKMYGRFPVPHWDGAPLLKRSLFVQFEQGIGDRILLSRFLNELRTRHPAARIVTCINRDLLPLFWQFRKACAIEFLHDGIPWPDDIDCAIYAGSLPHYLGVKADKILHDPGLIRAAALAHHERAPFNLPQPNAAGALKIGIAWTGNPAQLRNEDRSVPLGELAALAADPRIVLYSLQVGPAAGDVARLGLEQLICDITPDLAANGFMATALAMLQLDAIVTVCTSTAHLAGALGIPCLMLTSFDPYWIWGRSGSSTSWYPSLTLIRQEDPGIWGGAIAEAGNRLARMGQNRV